MRIIRMLKGKVKNNLGKLLHNLFISSLKSAVKEQGLDKFVQKLEKIVPDLTNQYTTCLIDNDYLKVKVRSQHAYQISLFDYIVGEFNSPVIVDIGDSAGTHIKYILEMYFKDNQVRCISVNLDENAIRKIKEKGLEAINIKAENLHELKIDADIYLCYQTLEHIMDPCNFLHQLSEKTKARYLIVTVPYVQKSRVGLYQIRRNEKKDYFAENTHIFELSPKDLKLISTHSGWRVKFERIYYQYPRRNLLLLTKPLWQKYDFEGFYGLILERDNTFSKYYKDW